MKHADFLIEMNVRTMSLKSKALVVLAVPLLMLVATTVLTSGALRQSEEKDARVAHAYHVEERITAVLDNLVDVETGVRGYLLTADERFLDPYWDGSGVIAENLQRLQLAVEHERGRDQMLRLRELVKRRIDILERLRINADELSAERSRLVPLLVRGRIVMEEIRGLLDTMTRQQQLTIESSRREADRTRRVAFLVAVAGAPAGMLLALVVVLGFNERTIRRLARVEENVSRLELGESMVEPDDAEDEIGRLGRALVRSGTLAIELRDELQRLASVDPLTSLVNRRGLMPLLEHQLELARRHREPVALLFVDVDGLKAVNDAMGHAVGDEMLAETGALLRDTFRTSDVAARLGGDEFCVMLTGESAATSEVAISRLLGAVESANRLPGRPFTLSLSIGAAVFDPIRPITADELITWADARMYEHKRAKRSAAPAPA